MDPVSVIRKFQGVLKGGEETQRERERESDRDENNLKDSNW